ncbi:MAG TPA: hypothetical protein VGK73_06875 [Polyangiaceae bacterium]
MTRPWTVLEHSPLQKLEDNLWEVEGAVPGFPMRRRMALIRLSDGSIVVHNAICLGEEAQRAVEAWGTVRYIVVPNPWHRLDAPAYAARYPDARVLCPRPAYRRATQVVRVDGNLDGLPADTALTAEPLAGSRIDEHVFVVRSGERKTLVFGDTLMNNPKLPGFKGWAYGLTGSTSNGPVGKPMVTPLAKLVMVADRSSLRAHLERLAAAPGLERVLPGHGTMVEGGGAAAMLTEALASL